MVVSEPGSEVPEKKLIPRRYKIPELAVGMVYRDFLAEYWGDAGADYMAYLQESAWGSNLDKVNSTDWNKGTPIGTIEDYFAGLEERTKRDFHHVYDPVILEPPHLFTGLYTNPASLIGLVIKSHAYNPEGKEVPPQLKASLLALIKEQSSLPSVLAKDIIQRWDKIIHADVGRIVNYEDPIYGKEFISPIVATPFRTEPDVAITKPYPVLNISLPGPRRDLVDTAAGFFNGWLTVWAGNDSKLAFLYDELSSSSSIFEASIRSFFRDI
jgi:hypothetical protein